MGWNSPNSSKRTRPLVVRWDRPDGGKESAAFPGGVDKSIVWLVTYCIEKAIEMGYPPKNNQCWGFFFRVIAGTTIVSYHGRGGGRAIDYNAPENGRGGRGEIPMNVVEVFENAGFTWGGRWDYTDPMHFEARKSRFFYYRKTRKMKRHMSKNRG